MVLIGRQGIGKSTYLRELFPEALQQDCFSDTVTTDVREAAIAYARFAVIEYGELAQMSRRSIESIKQELSAREATVRPAYARVAKTMPRRAVVAGTTNEDEFLVDVENRRFLPVGVGRLDLDRLRRTRDLIWAAARLLFEAGEPWWLNAEESAALAEVHEQHEYGDPWTEIVATFLAQPVSLQVWGSELEAGQVVDGHWARLRLRDVGAALGLPTAMSSADGRRLGRVLRKLGWEKFRGSGTGRQMLWRRVA
jgi:predicted P-loop ATPase